MASLIGINWPVNSVGVLPDVDPTKPGYLLPLLGDETLARASLVNAKVSSVDCPLCNAFSDKSSKVILEHYRVKHGAIYSSIRTVFGSNVHNRTQKEPNNSL
jgi:phosphatidylinositol glycan class N